MQKDKVRKLTKRNRGIKLAEIIKQLNEQLTCWIGYFRLTEYQNQLETLDGWIRKKLRCYRLKQRKRNRSIAQFLILLRVKPKVAWLTAKSGRGAGGDYQELQHCTEH